MVYCLSCGTLIEEWDNGYYARNMLCIPCYQTRMSESIKKQCFTCARRVRPEEGGSLGGHFFCESCLAVERARIDKITCFGCKKILESWEQRHPTPDGKILCDKCYNAGMGRLGARACYKCGRATEMKFVSEEGRNFCPKCWAVVEKHEAQGRPLLEKVKALVKRVASGDDEER